MLRVSWLLLVATSVAACKKSPPKAAEEPVMEAAVAARPVERSRCAPASQEGPFVFGPKGAQKTSPRTLADQVDPSRDDPLPFASEVGDGVRWGGGFAVGALGELDAAPTVSVVILGPDGQSARVIGLGATHGDVEPPRLAARGDVIFAGVLEPEANGRSLRLARIKDGNVTWGAAVHQRGGESQAFDMALGEKRGVVVWDEEGPANGVVLASTFDVTTASSTTVPRAISPSSADAESPRLLARPDGGYWLAYIARAGNSEDADARYGADDVGFRWIEIVPLDANGSPVGAARVVTPKDGHVLVFDLAPADDGAALLVFRYDDTPIGSPGGRVMRTVVRAQGSEPPQVLVEGGDVGAGVPSVLGGWLAVADAADATRLAPIRTNGELLGPLLAEPDIGSGEPVAADRDRLLVARPAGRAIKLLVVRCTLAPGSETP